MSFVVGVGLFDTFQRIFLDGTYACTLEVQSFSWPSQFQIVWGKERWGNKLLGLIDNVHFFSLLF